MVGYIYLITDTTNGMKYTGKHHYHIEGQLDPNYHGSGTIIKNIYKKRPETLKEEYIKTCYSEEEMCSDEQYYIEVFDTLYPNGYNLTEGGDGCVASEETRRKMSQNHYDCSGKNHPMFGKHHTEESKKKMSNSHKGQISPNKGKPMSEEQKKKLSEANKNISDETRKKMSESHKGKPSPNKGKKMSEETRRKLSESHKGQIPPNKGKPHSEESKKKMSESHKGQIPPNKGKPMSEEQKKKLSKIVLQFSLDGIFICEWYSINEAQSKLGIKHISDCCLGKRKSAGGFLWMFKEE